MDTRLAKATSWTSVSGTAEYAAKLYSLLNLVPIHYSTLPVKLNAVETGSIYSGPKCTTQTRFEGSKTNLAFFL